jgi:hypothetical protein
MKNFNFLYLSAYLVLFSLTSFVEANGDFSWKPDGSVSDTAGRHITIDILSVFEGQEYRKSLFLLGYKIDKSGINYPTAARISSKLKETDYWSFDYFLNDIFVYQDKIYIAADNGVVYTLKNSNWVKSSLKLNPNSYVVLSDDDIVACYPSSLLKADQSIGACYSTKKKWNVTVNWWDQTPTICHGSLYVYEDNNDGKIVKKINLDTGKVQNSKRVSKMPDHICEIAF